MPKTGKQPTTGERIKQLRKSKRLSQEQLADLCGVGHKVVCKWENDYFLPYADNLCKLSDIFGVSINYILKGEKVNDCRAENQTAPIVQTGMVEGRAGDNARKAE